MSLINEALKKAQRQRSLESAPLSAAPSGVAAAAVTTHVRAASHKRSHTALWFGLGLVSLGAAATVLIMRYGIEPAPSAASAIPAKPASPAPSPASAPSSVSPASPAISDSPSAAPMIVLPAIPRPVHADAPAASSHSTPVVPIDSKKPAAGSAASAVPPSEGAVASTSTSPLATEESIASAASASPVVPVAALPTPAEREAKIYAFLSALRLTGVRGQDREARVLMNERVWRLNDLVSAELGLRLSAIRSNLLVFTDAHGKTYEKPY